MANERSRNTLKNRHKSMSTTVITVRQHTSSTKYATKAMPERTTIQATRRPVLWTQNSNLLYDLNTEIFYGGDTTTCSKAATTTCAIGAIQQPPLWPQLSNLLNCTSKMYSYRAQTQQPSFAPVHINPHYALTRTPFSQLSLPQRDQYT